MSEAISSECRDQRVTIFKISLDYCDNAHGQGACSASGTQCFNTWNTCQRKCDYSCSVKHYWFTSCLVPPHLATSYTPNIISVDSNPTSLEIGKTFSTRGRIKVCLQDMPHNDQGFDPYWQDRSVIPIVCADDVQGTLFGRWIERVKYFENRLVEIYNGYCDQPLCDFVKETYFIDKVEPPDASGKVCFTLKDPLVLAEDKNAQCPRAESKTVATQIIGNEYELPFTLGVDLDGVDDDPDDDEIARPYSQVNQYLFRNNYLLGDPKQDACFARLKHICIGKEVLRVRAEVNNATPQGWNVVLLDRGVCGSPISPHKSGAKVALAETFDKEHVTDVVLRMLLSCTDLSDVAIACCEDEPINLINYESFEQYRCDAPQSMVGEVIICKSTGLTTLLNELSDQFMFFLFFNAETGKIEIKNLAPPACNLVVPKIENCQIAKGSFSRRQTDDRYNQITYFHNTINCAESLSDSNLGDVTVSISADALAETCNRREYKTRKNKIIKSRWIDECNKYIARANGERWLMLRNCPAEQVTIDTTFDVGKCVEMGGFAQIEHDRLQDETGGPLQDYWMLKGKHNVKDCTRLTFERTAFNNNMTACFDCDSECVSVVVEPDPCGAYDDCVGIW